MDSILDNMIEGVCVICNIPIKISERMTCFPFLSDGNNSFVAYSAGVEKSMLPLTSKVSTWVECTSFNSEGILFCGHACESGAQIAKATGEPMIELGARNVAV